MKFSTREDIAAPIDQVFAALCAFDGFERQAMRRGIEVQRINDVALAGPGTTWKAAFSFRGKRRTFVIENTRLDQPSELVFHARSSGLEVIVDVELLALSRNRTRLVLGIELTPLNLPTRLLVQSFKLAKASLTKKLKLRVAEQTKALEDRLQSRAHSRPGAAG